MAENRAAFSLRRRFSLGFSKCRWLRTTFSVPSRSIFFLSRRSAFSTDSPFLSLISVNPSHFLSIDSGEPAVLPARHFHRLAQSICLIPGLSTGKTGAAKLRKGLAFAGALRPWCAMGLPGQPVTLTVEQIDQLNRKLATMRHDINGSLSLIVAALELRRLKPEMADQMLNKLGEQPAKITDKLSKFSAEFEQAMGITRP